MFDNVFGIVCFPAITVICYLVAQACKATKLDNKWLPVICGGMGGVLGIVSMLVVPDFPANDIISAAAVGIISGLAATGINQIFKQMKGDGGNGDTKETDSVQQVVSNTKN